MTDFTRTASYNLGYLVVYIRGIAQSAEHGAITPKQALDLITKAAREAEARYRVTF